MPSDIWIPLKKTLADQELLKHKPREDSRHTWNPERRDDCEGKTVDYLYQKTHGLNTVQLYNYNIYFIPLTARTSGTKSITVHLQQCSHCCSWETCIIRGIPELPTPLDANETVCLGKSCYLQLYNWPTHVQNTQKVKTKNYRYAVTDSKAPCWYRRER